MRQTVASQVGSATTGVTDAGSELASAAKDRAKTFASELEGIARRNPLGTIAGALLIGDVAGTWLMFAALRCAVSADIDRQIGWAKDQLKRQTRYTAVTGIIAGVAALAALGAVAVGLIALHSWLAMQIGPFVAHGLIGGGLLLLALILVPKRAAADRAGGRADSIGRIRAAS